MTTHTLAGPIEVYWLPGCSSCLRMKEFIETTKLPFESVNVAASPERIEKLNKIGVGVPAVAVGNEAVQGVDLVGIAKLIGYDYEPPQSLPPAEMKARYDLVIAAIQRFLGQLSDEDLEFRHPENNRSNRYLVAHASTIMRMFVECYDQEKYNNSGRPPQELGTVATRDELIAYAAETSRQLNAWWDEYGYDDPFDSIKETSWGHRTLHEILERATWHTAQHTRQLQSWMQENLGIAPAQPLTDADLAGLPLPKRIMS